MGRVGPARASALPRRGPQRPVGSAGVTCLISTVDGLRRTPEIRQGRPRHGPRASLSASKVSAQRFPRRTGRRWRFPVHPVRLTNLGGHRRSARAGSGMVRGHPCPHQRCQRSTSPRLTGRRWRVPVHPVQLSDLGGHRKFAGAGRDARGPGICALQSPSGVLGVCRSRVATATPRRDEGFSPLPGL